MKKILALTFLVPTFAWSQTSYVSPSQVLRKKGYELQFGGDMFKSSKRIDADGTKLDFPDGESFTRYQGEVSGYYGATDDLQFGIGARFRQNKAIQMINGQEVETVGQGLQSTFASIMYAFRPVGQMQYTLEGMFRFTPYANDEFNATDTEKMILGDDGNEMSGGMSVTYSFQNNNFLTARGGYRKPGSGLSGEIYWQAEGAMAWKYVALIAGANGVTSLSGDAHGDEPGSKPPLNTANTNLYNSINREWIAPYAGLNIALGDSWRVELRGSQVLSGRSTDLGTTFGINLVRRVETKEVNYITKNFKTYDLEASVTKVSPKKEFVVIDKGLDSDVEKGMAFDLFEFDYVGGNTLVARGIVVQVKASSAIVKLTQRFNAKKEIKQGLVGRARLK